jgi:hypothetical protein
MVGLIKPTLHIDEFVSKMGDDDDIMVISFYVRSDKVADDLINWFEKGYDFVLDADRSPGEIKPNRYLVYLEIQRRTRAVRQIKELLDDLETLTEHSVDDWTITFKDHEFKFDEDTLSNVLILSPREWRRHEEKTDASMNEMRIAAGIPVKSKRLDKDPELDIIRSQAGIL